MKRLAALFLLAILSVSCTVPAHAQYQTRASRKANQKRQKAMKKYAKAQRKAQRKMIKQDRKNTHYPSTIF